MGAFRFDGMDGIWLLAEFSEDESHFEDWVVVVHVEVRDVEELISDRFLSDGQVQNSKSTSCISSTSDVSGYLRGPFCSHFYLKLWHQSSIRGIALFCDISRTFNI